MRHSWVSVFIGVLVASNLSLAIPLADDVFSVSYAEVSYLDVLANDGLPDDARIVSVSFEPVSTPNMVYGFSSTRAQMLFLLRDENFTSTDIRYHLRYYSQGAIYEDSAMVTVSNSEGNAMDLTPFAVDDYYSLVVDREITLYPLQNDYDPEGQPLQLRIDSVDNGEATLVSNRIVFIPEEGFIGLATITYTISDIVANSASATIYIQVQDANVSNVAPFANDDRVVVSRGETVTLDVMQNDIDEDGDMFYVSSLSDSLAGIVASIVDDRIVIQASENFVGSGEIFYRISDGTDESNTATIVISLLTQNTAPVAVDDVVTLGGDGTVRIRPLANDWDPEGDEFSLSRIVRLTAGEAEIDGDEIRFQTSDPAFIRAEIVYAIVDENGLSAEGIVVVNAPTNLPPIANNDDVVTRSNREISIEPLLNDSDENPDTLVITRIDSVEHGTAVLMGNSIRYVSDEEYIGTDRIRYQISDALGLTATATVHIVVEKNHAPTARADFANTPVDTTLSLSVLSNDRDSDQDEIRLLSVETSAPGGQFFIAPNNILRFEPDAGFQGVVTATYTVADPSDATASAEVRVRVHSPVTKISDINLNSIDAAFVPDIVKTLRRGSFSELSVLGAGSDLNQDNVQDIVVRVNSTSVSSNQYLVLSGTALDAANHESLISSFPDAATYWLTSQSASLQKQKPLIGDFDDNGVADMLFLKEFGVLAYAVPDALPAEVDLASAHTASALNSDTPVVNSARVLDFNGDNIDDLAIAFSSLNGDVATKVRVLYGPILPWQNDVFAESPSSDRYLDITGFESTAILAQTIAFSSGDYNGDGIEDLALGQVDSSRDIAAGAGLVAIIWGRSSIAGSIDIDILETSEEQTQGVLIHAGAEVSESIGALMQSGDMNADGIDDLVLANSYRNAPDPTRQISRVTIVHGVRDWKTSGSITEHLADSNRAYQIKLQKLTGTEVRGEMIQSITVADINDDLYSDIALLTSRSLTIIKGNDSIKPSVMDAGPLNGDAPVVRFSFMGLMPEIGVADINNDDVHDFVITDYYRAASALNIVYGGLHFR